MTDRSIGRDTILDTETALGIKDRFLGLLPLSLTLAATSALLVILISACGSDDANDTSFTSAKATEVATSAPSINVEEIVHLLVGDYGESDQEGYATLTSKGDQTEIFISIDPYYDVPQAVYIRSADCYTISYGQEMGSEFVPLESLVNGQSISLVPFPLETLLSGGLSIKIHESEENSEGYTACAQIPARGESITIELKPMGPEGRYGSATLTNRKAQDLNKLKEGEVHELPSDHVQTIIRIDGLAGVHKASVHLGSCTRLSEIMAFDLEPVIDGISVSIFPSNYKGLLLRGTFVDVHSADEKTPPIVCGEIKRN